MRPKTKQLNLWDNFGHSEGNLHPKLDLKMATVINRDGRWQCKIRRQGYPVKTRTFSLKAEAEAWARQIESQMDRGEWQDRRAAERTTVGEAVKTWQTSILSKLAKSTQASDNVRCGIIQKDEIAKVALAKVSPLTIMDFIDRCDEAERSPATAFQYVMIISRTINTARELWGMPYLINPVSALPRERKSFLRQKGREARRLMGDEEAKLLEHSSKQMHRIIRFALQTAMRRSEISDLRWADVHEVERFALARDTKNGDNRRVPLSSKALSILAEIARPEKSENQKFVFQMSASAITQAMSDTCSRAEIDDLRFHDLRHEAISRLAATGRFPTSRLGAISGHKDIKMLAHYDHASIDELADAMDGI